MRRRAGIGAIQQRKLDSEKFKEKGNELAETQLKQLSSQLEQFQTNLETFAKVKVFPSDRLYKYISPPGTQTGNTKGPGV